MVLIFEMKTLSNSEYFDFSASDLSHMLANVHGWNVLRGKRILITGATGFIGKCLLASFLNANRRLHLGARVVVLSRDVDKFKNLYPFLKGASEIDWIQGDIRTFSLDAKLKCDMAIHAATDVIAKRRPSEIFEDCVSGTRNVIEQLDKVGCHRMLLLSSGAVYGSDIGSLECVSEDYMGAPDPLSVNSAYGEGKRAAELLCTMAGAERKLVIPIARCFAFVGPHLSLDKHFAIGNFISAAMKGRPIVIKGDGTPLRSYLYSADLAVWLWTLLFEGVGGRAYNVGGAETVSIEGLARRTAMILNSTSVISVEQQAQPGRPVQKYIPSLRRIEKELGLSAYFDLDTSIKKTANFYNEHD